MYLQKVLEVILAQREVFLQVVDAVFQYEALLNFPRFLNLPQQWWHLNQGIYGAKPSMHFMSLRQVQALISIKTHHCIIPHTYHMVECIYYYRYSENGPNNKKQIIYGFKEKQPKWNELAATGVESYCCSNLGRSSQHLAASLQFALPSLHTLPNALLLFAICI